MAAIVKHGASIDKPAVVSLQKVNKQFGNLRAIQDITLTVSAGECIGLVGHNGAGKSTLIKVINGRLSPTSGSIEYCIDQSEQVQSNAARARRIGIRSVFQELSLCPNLTVLENLRVPVPGLNGLNWRKIAHARIVSSLDAIFPGHSIHPKATVADLSIAQRQMVEIAIAFCERDVPAAMVILDEPTSSLDVTIARQLLDYVRSYCARGGAVIFITHMIVEIFEVATRILVMKDGLIIEDGQAHLFTRDSLVEAMGHVVKDTADVDASAARIPGNDVLSTPQGLSAKRHEIVGLAGLAGHGQSEALVSIYLSKTSVWHAPVDPEVVFVAGDRTRDGIMPLWSILRNLSLETLLQFSHGRMVDGDAEVTLAQKWREKIGIRTDDLNNSILSLSGGNQQKVLFARALASCAPIVVMDDPMRGVDVGTKRDVYDMIRKEATRGRTFIWYSTEIEEICECDRVFVFRDGIISAELTGADITEENILKASFAMKDSVA